jgi:hypothetical protein
MISSFFRGELDALNIPICACRESVRQLLGDDDDLAFGVPFAEIPQRPRGLARAVTGWMARPPARRGQMQAAGRGHLAE